MKSFPRSEFPIPFHATSGIGLSINSSGPGQHLIMCWARSHVEGAGVYQNLRQWQGVFGVFMAWTPRMSSHPSFGGGGAVYLLGIGTFQPPPKKCISFNGLGHFWQPLVYVSVTCPENSKRSHNLPSLLAKSPHNRVPFPGRLIFFMEIPYALAPSALIARANSGKRQS